VCIADPLRILELLAERNKWARGSSADREFCQPFRSCVDGLWSVLAQSGLQRETVTVVQGSGRIKRKSGGIDKLFTSCDQAHMYGATMLY
jgi:hypothetical protein